jgi:transposase
LAAQPSKLDAFKPYLEERLRAGVWNALVLLRELRERNFTGSYTILTDWLRPQRGAARVVAVRRFETAPGKQAQVDWGHLGTLEMAGQEQKLHCFTFTLGYSRRMVAEAALDQKLGTLLRLHEAAFQQIGGVPEEILYDRMKTVWLGTDERGEIVWHPVFLDFARYWGFTPRLCRPYRAQTKGKVESGVKYVRRNFLCGLQGREPDSLSDLNAQLRDWIWGVANQRVHGTTHEQVLVRWDVEQFSLQSLAGQPPYPYVDGELRKVARDAYVDWQGSRYSVPWQYAGQDVWVQEIAGEVDRTIVSNQPILGPTPYRGDALQLNLALVSVVSSDLAGPYLEVLSGLASAAGVSFVSVAQPFLKPLASGIDLLTGVKGASTREIQVVTNLAPLQTGVFVVMRATNKDIHLSDLRVASDYALQYSDG